MVSKIGTAEVKAIIQNLYSGIEIREGRRMPTKITGQATLNRIYKPNDQYPHYRSDFYEIVSTEDLSSVDMRVKEYDPNLISEGYTVIRNDYSGAILYQSGTTTYLGYQPKVANTLNEQNLTDHWSEKVGESNVETAPFPCGDGWTYIRKYPIPDVHPYRIAQLTYPEVGVNLYFSPAIVGTKAYTLQVDGNEAHPTNIKYDTFTNIEADEKYYRLNNNNARIFDTAKPEDDGFFYMKWSSTTDTFGWDEKTVPQMVVRYGIGYRAIYQEQLVFTCDHDLPHTMTFTLDSGCVLNVNGSGYSGTVGKNSISLPSNDVYTVSTTTTGIIMMSNISFIADLDNNPYFLQFTNKQFIKDKYYYTLECRY
jgi:hypothetical protein